MMIAVIWWFQVCCSLVENQKMIAVILVFHWLYRQVFTCFLCVEAGYYCSLIRHILQSPLLACLFCPWGICWTRGGLIRLCGGWVFLGIIDKTHSIVSAMHQYEKACLHVCFCPLGICRTRGGLIRYLHYMLIGE